MGWEIIAMHVLQNMLKEGRPLSSDEIALLVNLKDLIVNILTDNPRYCLDTEHKCEYREHACYIKFIKETNWQLSDIHKCPYRKMI